MKTLLEIGRIIAAGVGIYVVGSVIVVSLMCGFIWLVSLL